MKANKIYSLIFLLFFLNIAVHGQTNPPPMAMPKDSNEILVDKIIEITSHEKYFIDYCSKKVKFYAQENSWSPEKTNEILGSIKFKYYNSTIYNSYAFYSTDQLRKLLDVLTSLNNSKNSMTMILTNSMMQSNLDLFVKSVIEGKYITKN